MKEKNCDQFNISVRNLVEFIFREGDIDNRKKKLQNADAMLEGTRVHREIQKSMGKGYQSEVPLKILFHEEAYTFTIEGRADGIYEEDGIVYIDEIKGSYRKLSLLEEPVFVHKAQAMCYAYIYANQNLLDHIGIVLTYCHLETKEKKYFKEVIPFLQLQEWFMELYHCYKKWADFQFQWKRIRQKSIHKMEFPFSYREGQKKLVEDVYRSIYREKILFLQAPTGVGKTISTIFPAVKAVGENLAERIFYLTAKTITATVAYDTFMLLNKGGYRAKTIRLTAKEKMCLCDEMDCNPSVCPYAKGHFDRVNDAVFDILQKSDFFDREIIVLHAKEYMVCPFEFSLDIASWVDNIICDYNYVFDPNVYLKRFFQENVRGEYIFLVDEAHNLVERSRKMYSAMLDKDEFLTVKKIVRNYSVPLVKCLEHCNKQLLELKRECETYKTYESVGTIYFSLLRLFSELDEFLQKDIEFENRKTVLDFYFMVRNFLNVCELLDDKYVVYGKIAENNRFLYQLFCVDPSENLQRCLNRAKATVFFSATLLPVNYYKRLLSTKKDNYAIYAHSVFENHQRLILVGNDVSTKYKRRNENEFKRIALYIAKTIRVKKGNYMCFFPSYALMKAVHEQFERLDATDYEVIIQNNKMSEEQREEFLSHFYCENHSVLAFCVLGGIFSEGIDLKENKLIGAIIVGTGLPQVSDEQEILQNYYNANGENGFDYAYRYPGMNKVLQAAGRVIRTTEDKGVILLLDERFCEYEYTRLFPREWESRIVCNQGRMEPYLKEFWDEI